MIQATFVGGIAGLASELQHLNSLILQFLFSMLRVGSFVISAPFFSARFVPLHVKIITSACLAIPIMASQDIQGQISPIGLHTIILILIEIGIGLSAGLVLQILFAVAVIAGDRIANTAGLGLAAQVDPNTGAQSPVIGQFFSLFLISIFVLHDGHLVAIAILVESYSFPISSISEEFSRIAMEGSGLASAMLREACRLMMPVVSILLILNIVIGVITRSSPQLNIFAFGFPLTMSATIILLFVTAVGFADHLSNLVFQSLEMMRSIILGV